MKSLYQFFSHLFDLCHLDIPLSTLLQRTGIWIFNLCEAVKQWAIPGGWLLHFAMQTEKFWRNITGILVQPRFYVSGHIISLFASKDQSGFDWNATFYHFSLLWHTAMRCMVRSFPLRMPRALSLTLEKGAFTSSLLIFHLAFTFNFKIGKGYIETMTFLQLHMTFGTTNPLWKVCELNGSVDGPSLHYLLNRQRSNEDDTRIPKCLWCSAPLTVLTSIYWEK